MNDDADIAYAREAPDGGRLSQPVLFVNGDFDQVCTIIGNRQGDPMRAACSDLTVRSLPQRTLATAGTQGRTRPGHPHLAR